MLIFCFKIINDLIGLLDYEDILALQKKTLMVIMLESHNVVKNCMITANASSRFSHCLQSNQFTFG
jgi:hypothetical protein